MFPAAAVAAAETAAVAASGVISSAALADFICGEAYCALGAVAESAGVFLAALVGKSGVSILIVTSNPLRFALRWAEALLGPEDKVIAADCKQQQQQ